jgi:hypothetical protein
MATTPPVADQENNPEQPTGQILTPIDLSAYPPRGKYASFDVSTEDMFGPDELGEYKSAIDDMSDVATKADSAARNFEVLQASEQRLFRRGYQFLNAGRNGWSLFGSVNGSKASGQEIMQSQNAGNLFACNVFGTRERKFSSAIARDVPGVTFSPKSTRDPIDQEAADEAKKYWQVWVNQAGMKDVAAKIARLMWTDGRVVLYTRSVADEQAWGAETPDQQQDAFGVPSPDGITAETELQNDQSTEVGEQPAVREVTTAFGKLEHKCPIYCDEQSEMPWQRLSWERNVNMLKERYPWIEDKIKAGGAGSKNGGGADQLDRQERIRVRLAVQSSTSSGDSVQQDATETYTWYRPSQYRAITKKEVRDLFFDTFPDGLLVVQAGGELAFIRNESMDKCLRIVHPYDGDGQNRDSVGSNYLPIQKRLNANLSLADRIFRSSVARRFADAEALDVEVYSKLPNDPDVIIPVKRNAMDSMDNITSLEKVPSIGNGHLEYIEYLIEKMPEQMDGMTPAIWGGSDGESDQGVYATAQLKRNQALQILSMPWSHMNMALADAAGQAVQWGAKNRLTNIDANIPGEGRITVELSKLQGSVVCEPESMEIPQTIAEQEAQMAELIEGSTKIPLYGNIVNNPLNLPRMSRFPSLNGLSIDGVADVEQQEGELELLMQAGPMPNPQIAQLQMQLQQIAQQLQMAEMEPEAQTPEGQQAVMQLQQAEQELGQQLQQLQQTKPLVSSVPVAQNASENHQVHAVVTLDWMKSAEGRKYKNGSDQQKAVFQNAALHWQEHVEMGQQLTPPKELEGRFNVTVDTSKMPPEAASKAYQALGLQVSPQELTDEHTLVPREVTVEKEGVNEQGVPVKSKTTMSNPASKLN